MDHASGQMMNAKWIATGDATWMSHGQANDDRDVTRRSEASAAKMVYVGGLDCREICRGRWR